jgi:hypothetical protein
MTRICIGEVWVRSSIVEGFEIVVVPLDVGALDHLEAHSREDAADLPHHLGRGMQSAEGKGVTGKGDVEATALD